MRNEIKIPNEMVEVISISALSAALKYIEILKTLQA